MCGINHLTSRVKSCRLMKFDRSIRRIKENGDMQYMKECTSQGNWLLEWVVSRSTSTIRLRSAYTPELFVACSLYKGGCLGGSWKVPDNYIGWQSSTLCWLVFNFVCLILSRKYIVLAGFPCLYCGDWVRLPVRWCCLLSVSWLLVFSSILWVSYTTIVWFSVVYCQLAEPQLFCV